MTFSASLRFDFYLEKLSSIYRVITEFIFCVGLESLYYRLFN